MFNYLNRQKERILFSTISRVVVCILSLSLVFAPSAVYAQNINLLNLPTPGTMVLTSPTFTPAIVTGIKIYPDNPLQFDFIIDIGDDQLQGEALKEESQKLINYFMATLTVPEDEMWVNLSPYEKDRIIAEGLSYTEMGRDMLSQDYLLKQLTASLMYPEDDFGKEFWKRVYAKAEAKYGTTEIPMNTFNKIWIVPDEAVVYVHETNVFVVENHLKVMLEEDYLALESNIGSTKHGLGNITKDDIEVVSGVSAEIIREVLLPEIEKEVNEGKNFANLRQMYNSMLLATWYKKNLKESLLGQIYADKNKVNGIEIEDKEMKQKIYDQYVEAFKKGVYNYIKEDVDLVTKEIIPRKYFSGGLDDYLSEDGNNRFTEATGSIPSVLVSKARRPHVTAKVRGQTLGKDGQGSSPLGDFGEDVVFGRLEHRIKPRMAEEDLLAIAELMGEVLGLDDEEVTRFLAVLSERQGQLHYVVRRKGHIIGFITGGPLENYGEIIKLPGPLQDDQLGSENTFFYHEWMLTKNERGKGIGKELLSRFTEEIRKNEKIHFLTRSVYREDRKRIQADEEIVHEFYDDKQERWFYYVRKAIRSEKSESMFRSERGRDGTSSPITSNTRIADGDQDMRSVPGGIDFNPNNINLNEQGDKIQINFSADGIQNLNLESINGILPVIINISPLPSVLPLLGLEPRKKENYIEVSSLN